MNARKQNLLNALRAFIQQRSGMDPQNYGDWKAYRAESRSVTKDLHHARALLSYVACRDSITAERIVAASRGAFSGRLTIEPRGKDGFAVSYCTGQYFPTEYRRAVCAVLASAIWDWAREECMPSGVLVHNSETGETFKRYEGLRAGDYLRRFARRELGRSIAGRFFS